ncbi:unnamed protein product [Allacma fusca]|uniref:GH18 domain-containing protein n=1 Tax=Allacma fusca TaxID=39272 RepID=A0A8J2P0A7_9HEXA|nr:unnamed protein product [Allacma fusca]
MSHCVCLTTAVEHNNFYRSGGQHLGNDTCAADKRMQVFCYVALWYPETYSGYYAGVSATDMDPFLCSHIVIAYFEFTVESDIVVFSPNVQREALVRSIIHKGQSKRSTQFLLAVGGYNDFQYAEYSKIARNQNLRNNFVNSVVTLLRRLQVDGVDFMWNFIGRREHADIGNKYEDLIDLGEITKALCSRMKTEGFICVITLVKVENRDQLSNEKYTNLITTIIREADFVNIWTTDITPPSKGAGSALVPRDLLIPNYPPRSGGYYQGYSDHSINFVVDFYQQASKYNSDLLKKLSLVIALDFPTHGFQRRDRVNINTTTALHTDDNPVTGSRRYQFPYFEICDNLLKEPSRWKVIEFPGGVPIAIDYGLNADSKNIVAIPTLNEAYVKKKVAFARSQNLGGISIFHVTADDISGRCRNQTYPILNAINDELNGCRFF